MCINQTSTFPLFVNQNNILIEIANHTLTKLSHMELDLSGGKYKFLKRKTMRRVWSSLKITILILTVMFVWTDSSHDRWTKGIPPALPGIYLFSV